MKTKAYPLFRSLVVCGTAAFLASQSAMAIDYTYTPPAAGTGGTVNWSTGTHWDATPIGGIDTRLFFGGTLNASAAVASANDVAAPPFKLNDLTFNASGPVSGTAPTYAISGSQLELITNTALATPTMTLNATGTVKPGLTISNALLLTNDLTINATTSGTFTGLISGASNLAIVGPSTVNLNNTGNTFGGATKTITVSGGGVARTNSESSFGGLGSSSNKLVLNGGTYIAGGFNDFSGSFDRAIEFQTGGTNNIQAQAGAASREAWFGSALTGAGGFTTVGTGAPIIIGNLSGANDTLTGTVRSGAETIYVGANATRDALGGADLNIQGGNFHFGGNSGSAVSIANFSRAIAVNSSHGLGAANNYTFTHTGTLTGASTLSINNQTTAQEAKGSVAQIVAAGANSVVNLNGNMSGFTGGLNIVNGKLVIGTSATLPTSFGAATFSNATGVNLDLNGRSITVKGLVTGGTLGGNIQGNSTGSANTLTTDTTGTNRSYGGIISNGGSVALNLSKIGSNTQTLTGANTYTGTTTIATGGALNIQHPSGLGSTATGTTVDSGGALQLQGSIAIGAEALTLTGTGVSNDGALRNISGSNSYAGAITLGGATRINSDTASTTLNLFGGISGIHTNLSVGGAGNTNITNSISTGTGSLTKDGTGTLKLYAANSYTGGTTVSAGTLIATNASSLGTDGSLSIIGGNTFAYQPTTAGALSLGSGVLTLVNTNKIGVALGGSLGESAITSSSAAVTSGTVTVNIYGIPGVAVTSGSNDLITAASGLNGSTYTLGTITNATNFTLGTLTKTDTAVSIAATSATELTDVYWKGGFTGNLVTWAVSNGSTESNWGSDTGGTATSLTPGPTATIRFTGTSATNKTSMILGADMSVAGIVVNDTAPISLIADAHTLRLGTGGITVNSGAGTVGLGVPIALNGNQSWTNHSLSVMTVSGAVSGTGNLILNNGNATADAITLSGASVNHAGTIINSGAGTGSVLISAAIGSNVTGVTQNSTTSQLTLTGVNTYTGNTTVLTGTLALTNRASLYNGGAAAAWSKTNINVASGATLALRMGGAGQFAAADVVTLIGLADATNNGLNSGATLALDTTSASASISSTLANPNSGNNTLGLMKLGSNTLTLSAANSFSGLTTVAAGTLSVTAANGLGANNSITVNSTLNLGVSGAANYGGGQITVNNGGKITYGQNTGNGSSTTAKIAVPAAATAAIDFTSGTSNRHIGFAQNGLEIGAGATLNHTVTTGSQTGIMGSTEGVVTLLGNATVNTTAGFSLSSNQINYGKGVTGNFSLTKGGTGNLILGASVSSPAITGAASNYTGTTTVDAGVLRIGVADSLPDTALAVSLGATFDMSASGHNITSATFNQRVAGLNDGTGGGGTVTGNRINTANSGSIGNRTLTLDGTSGSYSFSGVIENKPVANATANSKLSLTKSGGSTQTLSGVNTYTGATAVTGGVLALVGGSQASAITVDSGASLGFTLGSPTTSTQTVTFSGATPKVKITGATGSPSYTLMTTTVPLGITGTPVLDPVVPGYTLAIESGGTVLKLNQTGGISAYDQWALDKGLTGAPGSATDPANTADPDKDGASNLAEFAFNGDPLSGSNNGQVYGLTADTDADTLKELILTLAVRKTTAAFVAGIPSTATSVADDITYSIEGSATLSGFLLGVTPVTPMVDPGPPISGPQAADYEYRSFRLDGSNGLPTKGFLRAKVTKP